MSTPRDKVLEVTRDGKRIFARNARGVPICFSRRGKGDGSRCQSTMTMPNGRCKMHGGNSVAGIMHWNAQHLRTANNLPKHLQGDMVRALNDPDQLNLSHELALTDTHIAQIKGALDTGLDDAAWRKAKSLANQLEHSLIHDPEESEALCTKLIEVIRIGSGQRTVWKEYHEVEEYRRKLVDTAHRREKDLRTLLKADQAIALVTGVAGACREEIGRTVIEIESRYRLIEKQTGKEVPRLDSTVRTDFLSRVSIALGKLIGQARPSNAPVPGENEEAIPMPTPLMNRKKQVKPEIYEDIEDIDNE